jgi:hypothetical protein
LQIFSLRGCATIGLPLFAALFKAQRWEFSGQGLAHIAKVTLGFYFLDLGIHGRIASSSIC